MLKSVMGAAMLLASTSAFAQTQAVSPPQPQPADDASSPADIVVTATKRAQGMQDVSASISAVGADRLASSQVNNLQDLQTLVPSVNFGSDFNQAKIFIRGVGANTSTTGSSTGVALHVDGVYVARAEAQLTSLFDLERVEVLRGPQGTLYGRNAVGGSVNLITAKPTDSFGGYARLTYGNYNALVGEVAIGGPILSGVNFRIAAKTESHDGFGINPVSGAGVDDLNRRMVRGQLSFDLGPKASLLLSGEYFRQNDSSGAVHYLRASFPGVPRLAPLGAGGYAVNPRDLATESQPGTDTKSLALTGTLKVPLSDKITVTDIVGYRKFKTSLYQDLDLSAVTEGFTINGFPTTVQERRIDAQQVSNELQLTYASKFINVVLGAFYFNEVQHPIDNVGFQRRNGLATNIAILQRDNIPLDLAYTLCGFGPGTTTNGALIAPKRVCTRSNLYTDNWAVFGQANVDFGTFSDSLSGLSLKLGGRYSYEKVKSENPGIVIRYSPAGATLSALPTLNPTVASTHRERTFRRFTPEVGLSWAFAHNSLAYYTYSEGFKAGSGENSSGSTTIVDPETIQNHEVGIKATVAHGVTINLAAYTYSLQGLQLNKTIAGGPTGYTTIFQNAASTKAKGLELEFFLRPLHELRINGGLSYTDSTFGNYLTLDPLNPANVLGGPAYNAVTNPDPTAFGAPGSGNIQLAGNRTRNTPVWAWNVHGEYDIAAPSLGGQFMLAADVSHKGRTYFTEFQRAIESSAGFTMLDGSISYTTDDKKIKAQIWVKNVTAVFRPSSTFALATGRLIGATYLVPRTFGATVGFNF